MNSASPVGGHVLLPDAPAPIVLPAGWTVDEAAAALILVAPDGDVRVAFVAAPHLGSPAATAASAWQFVDDSFDLPMGNQAETASSNGWGVVHEIGYRTAAAEGRIAAAIVRRLGERAYVNLLWGTKAGMSRRMAQVGGVIDAWRPEGLEDIDLSGREPVAWAAHDSDALAALTRAAMREMKIPGAAIAVVQNGAIVFAQGFGVTSVDDPRPVTADTRFMIGSTTKSLTTLMMARLVESGRFAWSTPVTDLLPGFALADPGVTAKLQLRHTVGAGTGMPRRDLDLFFRTDGITAADRIAEMAEMTPSTAFGETFQYSNYLVAAGGYAAARAFSPDGTLETAFENAMRAVVFEPLGMTRSTVAPRDDACDGEAAPHALDITGNVVAIDPAFEHFTDAVAPAGAARSTASDLARYLILELGGGAPAVRREPQIEIDGTSSYGLGLFLTRDRGIAVIEHGGNTIGFTSDMFFLPDKGLGAVVLTNIGGVHGGMYGANAFRAAVRQRIFELAFAAPATSEQTIASATRSMNLAIESNRDRIDTNASSTGWLEEWVGEYRCKELGPARVSRSAGGYRVDFGSWGSELAVETQPGGGRMIVLISPPWSSVMRLRPAASGNELILDGWQTQYVFARA